MERTVTDIRGVRNTVTVIFLCIEVIIVIGALINSIDMGDALVGLATILLGFATFYLVFGEMEEGIRNRDQARVEAEIDRRRVRLNEMLDGLYAPLYGIGKRDFFDRFNHRATSHYIHLMMKELKSKYSYLALESLKEALDHYYTLDLLELGIEEWGSIVEPLWDEITTNYELLVNEYNRITIPEV